MESVRQLFVTRGFMKHEIIEAFHAVRTRESPDVVVADPALNRRLIAVCREKGNAESAEALNRDLLNARKAGYLKGIKSQRIIVANQEAFRFASEIAVRFLERRDAVTLDQILCDPERVIEFDKIASEIAPGFSPFDYRWAALGLRKTRKLKPELIAKVLENVVTQRHRVSELDIESIPNDQGVYMFHDSKSTLYVGEAISLYKRVKKHLDHSDNKGLAHWLWQHGAGDLHLEIHILPRKTPTRVRKALEAEMIHSRRPLFNVAGASL